MKGGGSFGGRSSGSPYGGKYDFVQTISFFLVKISWFSCTSVYTLFFVGGYGSGSGSGGYGGRRF